MTKVDPVRPSLFVGDHPLPGAEQRDDEGGDDDDKLYAATSVGDRNNDIVDLCKIRCWAGDPTRWHFWQYTKSGHVKW